MLLMAQKSVRLQGESDYYKSAKRFLDAGDVALAIGYCEKGLKEEPENMDLQNLLAKAYLLNGQLDKARTKLLFILKVQPHNWDARRRLVNVEYEAKHYSTALWHINEFQKHAPYDGEMWMKKISIYDELGHKRDAERLANRWYTIFPNDSNAQKINSYYSLNKATQSVKSGNIYKAKEDIMNLLKSDPQNYDAHVQLINTHLKSGSKDEALIATENALTRFPGNRYLISKKLGILEETKRYGEALDFAKFIQKRYPGAGYQSYINNLKYQAARQAKNNDAYAMYLDILESNPNDEEARTYVINTAISRGLYEEASSFVDKALKSRPNDNNLLQKKLYILRATHREGPAFVLAESLYQKNRGNKDIQEQYVNLALAQGKGYLAEQEWDKAEEVFRKINSFSDAQPLAKEYLFSIYNQQKKYPQALSAINDLIRNYPRNENYKFKKIGVLESMGDLEGALEATQALPRNIKYKETYTNLSLPLAKKMIEAEKYDSALIMVDKILLNEEDNFQAYIYAINVCSQIKQYQNGIGYADLALDYYPGNKEILLKRAGLFQALKNTQESVDILDKLQQAYPYNEKIKSALIEDRNLYAKKFERRNEKDSAMLNYKKNYELDPTDTTSIYKIVNLYLDQKNTDSALAYIQSGLELYPENTQLLLKSAVTYEMMNQFDSASKYATLLIPRNNLGRNYQDYADYLNSKELKNQGGILFLRTYFDTIQNTNSLASFQYSRFFKNNTYTFRLNYAARNNGSAIQHEMDWYHKINKRYYSEFNIGIANKTMFPFFKISGSLYRTLPKEYEVDAGLRYVRLKDFSTYSLLGGLSKTYNDIWLNFKGYLMFDGQYFYNAGRLSGRFYMNNRSEYFTVLGGWGTPPDDKSLDFLLNKFLGVVSRYVGAGYQKEYKYRTTIGVLGTWNNIRVTETGYANQYNLFITLLRRF